MKDGGEVRRVIVPWLYLLLPGFLPSQRRSRYMSEGRGDKGESGKEGTRDGEHGIKSDSTLFSSLS